MKLEARSKRMNLVRKHLDPLRRNLFARAVCVVLGCLPWVLAQCVGQPWCLVFRSVMSIRVTAVRVIVLVFVVVHAVVNSARGPMTKRCASYPALT